MPFAAIFDVDGVLIDSYRPHFLGWQRMCAELGIPFTEKEFLRGFGRTNRDIFDDLAPGRFTPEEVDALGAQKEVYYREIFAANPTIIPGAAELVDALHAAGFKLAVGSSGPPDNTDLALRMLGRAEKFSARVTGADVTRGKPDPQVFLMAAERLGVLAAEAAVIEDASPGVEAANRGGFASIALVGTASREKLAHAKLVVESLSELDPGRIAKLIRAPR